MPRMQMPNINLPRRTSTQAGGRSFGFARFSNERVSTVNIERASTVERGEPVDETIQRIDAAALEEEKVTQSNPYNQTIGSFCIICILTLFIGNGNHT